MLFKIIKFRTMKIDTPQIHSNDLQDPNYYITSVGKILRKFSLDELPQILHVISGKMSFVGPRPSLENQYLLIEKRNSNWHLMKTGRSILNFGKVLDNYGLTFHESNIENNEMNVRLLLRQMLRHAIFKIRKNFIIMACSE